MADINVGDVLENEDGLQGTVKSVTEGKALVEWTDAEGNITEETIDADVVEDDLTESVASETLKPNSAPADSKFAKLSAIVGALGKIEDMSILDQVLAQIGHEADPIPGGASAKNQATVAMKGAVKEEALSMFADDTLTEEFKSKAYTLFEAAVESRVALEEARLEEEYANAFDEATEAYAEEIESKIDQYLNYVAEEWMKENEVAIESALRNDIAESFINGMKTVFEEHFVDIPEAKVDIVEELAVKVQALEEKLDEAIEENNTLKEGAVHRSKSALIEKVSEGLVVIQKDKFKKLSETVEFDGNLDTFEKKLALIKEEFFANKKPVSTPNLNEHFEGGDQNTGATYASPEVRSYVDAISRTVKK